MGWRLIGIFLVVSGAIAATSAASLVWPGAWAEAFWSVRPGVYAQLAALGPLVAAGFAALSLLCLVLAIGWFRRRYWAWVATTTLIGFNITTDVGQLFFGRIFEGAMGILLGGAVFIYLLTSPAIRRNFRRSSRA